MQSRSEFACSSVLIAVRVCTERVLRVICREKAMRTARMAIEYWEKGIEEFVGVDFSGNPTV